MRSHGASLYWAAKLPVSVRFAAITRSPESQHTWSAPTRIEEWFSHNAVPGNIPRKQGGCATNLVSPASAIHTKRYVSLRV